MLTLTEIFTYEPNTGHIRFKISRGNRKSGDIAGNLRSDGYIRINCNGATYYNHVLAWYLYYGEWPRMEIDHKNRIRNDNKIDNLRLATDKMQRENTNRPEPKYGKYIWKKEHKRWHRKRPWQVMINRVQIKPYFSSLEEAIYARDMYLQSLSIEESA